MKIINRPDIAITMTSDFDWDALVHSFDWSGLYKECYAVVNGGSDENWEYPVLKNGYRIITLGLSLTTEDMSAIEAKCSSAFGPVGDWRTVAKWVDGLLFLIGDSYGTCDAVIRFDSVENGYQAVEYLEDTEQLNVSEPDRSAWFVAQMLSDLLPASRLIPIDENDSDKGWFWQDPENPR